MRLLLTALVLVPTMAFVPSSIVPMKLATPTRSRTRPTDMTIVASAFSDNALVINGMAFALYVTLSSAQDVFHTALASTMPVPDRTPLQASLDQASGDGEAIDRVCYPLDLPDDECESCEYHEEFSDYYGEEIWLCSSR